ncbi:MAG: NAD(P)-dependent oxidoreductase, partial [Gammaproteobacteria bacterium]|nr:NAD(P)-dependent oxidoreductase [Gammaproteobacteria bacterium]
MSYLPLFLNVENRLCLVVGGGEVALRKVQTLLRWGANIKLLAPSVDEAIYALEKSSGMLSIENRPFCEQDLDQCLLVVVTTDQAELNAHIAGLARSKGILVNV